MSQAPTTPGWFPDPSGRHEYRFWDGNTWTSAISDGGVQGQDMTPPPGAVPAQGDQWGGAAQAAGWAGAGAAGQQGWQQGSPPFGVAGGTGGPPGGSASSGSKRKWVIPVVAGVCVLAMVAALLGWRTWANRAPAAPTAVSSTAVDGKTIQVTWGAPEGGPEANEFVIRRDGEEVGRVPGTTFTFDDDTDLNPGQSYEYTVVSVANGKESSGATVSEAQTAAPEPGKLQAADKGNTSVRLDWARPADAVQPDSYVVYRDGQQVEVVDGAKTSFKDSGLAPATQYKYKVVSLWGSRESDATPTLKVRTNTPALSAARLDGDMDITVKMVRSPGGDWPKAGKSWKEFWSFAPKCNSGACDVVVNADMVPEGFKSSPFKMTLNQSGASYSGTKRTNITSCRKKNVNNTVVIKLKVKKADVVNGEWMALAVAGTVVIKSPYTKADGAYYCPAQQVNTAVTGRTAN